MIIPKRELCNYFFIKIDDQTNCSLKLDQTTFCSTFKTAAQLVFYKDCIYLNMTGDIICYICGGLVGCTLLGDTLEDAFAISYGVITLSNYTIKFHRGIFKLNTTYIYKYR